MHIHQPHFDADPSSHSPATRPSCTLYILSGDQTVPGTPMSTPCYPLPFLPFPPFALSLPLAALFRFYTTPSFGPLERDTPKSHAICLPADASIGQIKRPRGNKWGSRGRYIQNFPVISSFPREKFRLDVGTLSPEDGGEIFEDPFERFRSTRPTRESLGVEGGERSIERSRAIPERAFLIGKSWSSRVNTKCPVFSCSTYVTRPAPSPRVQFRGSGELKPPGVERRPEEAILTFVLPAGLSMRYFANGSPFVV